MDLLVDGEQCSRSAGKTSMGGSSIKLSLKAASLAEAIIVSKSMCRRSLEKFYRNFSVTKKLKSLQLFHGEKFRFMFSR